jgi:plasmid rolling circle replication initiator protein Rep
MYKSLKKTVKNDNTQVIQRMASNSLAQSLHLLNFCTQTQQYIDIDQTENQVVQTAWQYFLKVNTFLSIHSVICGKQLEQADFPYLG